MLSLFNNCQIMKRKATASIFFAMLAQVAFAGTGGSNDEVFFALTLLGFLVMIVLLFSGANYLRRNGRNLMRSTLSLPGKWASAIRRWMQSFHSIAQPEI